MNGDLTGAPLDRDVDALIGLRRDASDFVRSLEEAVDRWQSDVSDKILASGARRCRELAMLSEQFGADLPVPGTDRRQAWNAFLAYVGATARTVCSGIVEDLDAGKTLATIYDRTNEVLGALEETVDGLPGPTVVPMDPSRFEPVQGDGALVAARKTAFRGRRRLRRTLTRAGNLFRRSPLRIPAPVRTLSLQDHARAHVRGTARTALLAAEYDVRDAVAPALFRLQRATAAWARDVLSALDDADVGAWHVPESAFGPSVSPADDAPGDPRSRIALASETLTTELRAVADALSSVAVVCPVREGAESALARALDDGGTALYRSPGPLPVVSVPARPVPSGASDRTRLAAELVAFRVELAARESEFHVAVVDRVLVPLARSGREIRDLLDGVEADAIRCIDAGERTEVLLEVRTAASDRLERLVRELPQPERTEEAIRSASDQARAVIHERIESLPDVLRLPVGQRGRVRVVTLPLREQARQAFERDLVRRILEVYAPLRRDLVRVWNDSEHVLQVVETAFAAAAEELDSDGAGPERLQSARSLIDDGLRRAAELMDDGYESLQAPWGAMAESVHRLMREDWSVLKRTVHADDFLSKQWHGLRTRLRRSAELAILNTRTGWKRISGSAAVLFRAVRVRISGLVRIGRAAVGASDVAGSERLRTLEAVTGAAEVIAGLPLIYRKMFTLDALSEPVLAVNRQDDLAAVRDTFDRWKSGNGPGLFVVRAEPGSGRTSFLNLAARTLSAEARIVRVPLSERISEEPELVRLLAQALGQGSVHGNSLSGLERTVQAARIDPTVVILDDLEHLLLQTSGGTRLFENLLLFFARTDGDLFWCASIGDLAWRFLERTAPAATGLAVGHTLRPWDRESLRELIRERHRRTGMPLRFEVPADPPPILRQRLRRARTPEQVQKLLGDEFFDALARSSGQDPALAIYGWVRTGRFDEEGDTLTIPPFRALSFSFLSRLDTDRAFVLRAFLMHHTLSPEELAQIFRFPEDHAMANLETLLALGLIEPVTPGAPASYIVAGTRYRLRRLVLQPVRKYLAERHFVY